MNKQKYECLCFAWTLILFISLVRQRPSFKFKEFTTVTFSTAKKKQPKNIESSWTDDLKNPERYKLLSINI